MTSWYVYFTFFILPTELELGFYQLRSCRGCIISTGICHCHKRCFMLSQGVGHCNVVRSHSTYRDLVPCLCKNSMRNFDDLGIPSYTLESGPLSMGQTMRTSHYRTASPPPYDRCPQGHYGIAKLKFDSISREAWREICISLVLEAHLQRLRYIPSYLAHTSQFISG